MLNHFAMQWLTLMVDDTSTVDKQKKITLITAYSHQYYVLVYAIPFEMWWFYFFFFAIFAKQITKDYVMENTPVVISVVCNENEAKNQTQNIYEQYYVFVFVFAFVCLTLVFNVWNGIFLPFHSLLLFFHPHIFSMQCDMFEVWNDRAG